MEDSQYVQCDACDKWWHFKCVGITESVESVQQRAWICDDCVQGALKVQAAPQAGEPSPCASKALPKPKVKVDIVGADELSTLEGANHEARDAVHNLNNDPASDEVTAQLVMLKQRQDLEKRRLELELQLKFVREEEELLRFGKVEFSTFSAQFDSFQPKESAVKNSEEGSNITPRQAVARKTVSKELPTFTGDPAEWSIFISHYEHTTRQCGYSNWENMLRLQKCLKGPALEAVRSRLMLPEAVPRIIEKLRSRYGRPVLLIKTLIAKVRKIPPPQVDKLETLIEYGEAVQCMVDHMEAADARAHLTNPMLLEEVVGKLPKDQQLLWSHHIRGVDEDAVDLVMFSDYMEQLAEDAARLTTIDSPSMRGTFKGKRATNVSTFAFLDEGSSVTLVDEDLAVQLGVEGVVEPLCMRWTGDTTRVEKGSRRVSLKVGPTGSSRQFALNSMERFSRLERLQRTVGWVVRYVDNLRRRVHGES
uniref:PHD-type domain-containing protein n=1 Tax=Anopheles funestus TaxID=62324 RepID=A0A182RSB1_ANOFN